jgi:hypothetical protein
MQRIVTLVLAALVLAGCQMNVTRGSGNVVTETRPVSGYTSVRLAWLGDLAITQGDAEGLTIEAEDNILPLITTEVSGGTLVIGLDEPPGAGPILPTEPVKYTLQVRSLDAIDLSGAGNVHADALDAEQLALSLSGAGNVELGKLAAQDLTVHAGGAGNLSLAGEVATQDVRLSGLGNYDAGDLRSSDASVDLSGAGGATVWAEDNLDVKISGAGSVRYYGEPKVTQTVSGLGKVESLGSK